MVTEWVGKEKYEDQGDAGRTYEQKCKDPAKNQSYRHSSTSREAEVAVGGAHSSEKSWTLGVPRCSSNDSPALVNAALVGLQRVGQTILSASQVAAGSKRHKTVEYGTPYKRPMSSSGHRSE
ncbi:jg4925 [Pararge aegeria aegeria]|uniref:Jg4925 protein n=1 Tax=Pararge aegeria aegeria TaxID=348720 RepID=A0A8S4SGD5_9NEOP|nr:jg4925 [Pararge aegeria aegeria]